MIVRHPVAAIFVIALAVRVGGIVFVHLLPERAMSIDDITYSWLAEQMAAGRTAQWDAPTRALYWATATLLVPLTVFYRLFGPVPLLGQGLVALAGAGAAALVTRIALERLPGSWATAAGLVVALLPSQVVWSSILLKDAVVWLALCGLALTVTCGARRRDRRLVLPGLAAAALLFLLAHLRLHSAVVAAWALLLVAPIPRDSATAYRILGALLITLTIPWAAGGGPGGLHFISKKAGSLAEQRSLAAIGAESAFVAPPVAPSRPPRTARGPGGPGRPGPAPAAVGPSTSRATDAPTARAPAGTLETLLRGLSAMLLEPFPWAAHRNFRVVFAQIDTLLWYPILGLAMAGLWAVRGHAHVLAFPLVCGGGLAVMWAVAEGNLGTAFRHRSEFVWAAILLAAFGAHRWWSRVEPRPGGPRARAGRGGAATPRANVHDRSVDGFGREWQAFDQRAVDPGSRRETFAEYFRIFPWERLPAHAVGADFGCGSGRWAVMVAPRVGHLVLIDASADALEVARRNLETFANCAFIHAPVDEVPLADASLDFAYCLGVLHHVPDVERAVHAIARTLKAGAPLLVYLYYALDDRPRWFRVLWSVTDLLRRLISRLPFRIRYLVSQAIAASVYLPLAAAARWLDARGKLPEAWPLAYYRNKSFYAMRTDALDRFGTPFERRFRRADVGHLLTAAGFEQVVFSESPPYWCAVGVKHGTAPLRESGGAAGTRAGAGPS